MPALISEDQATMIMAQQMEKQEGLFLLNKKLIKEHAHPQYEIDGSQVKALLFGR